MAGRQRGERWQGRLRNPARVAQVSPRPAWGGGSCRAVCGSMHRSIIRGDQDRGLARGLISLPEGRLREGLKSDHAGPAPAAPMRPSHNQSHLSSSAARPARSRAPIGGECGLLGQSERAVAQRPMGVRWAGRRQARAHWVPRETQSSPPGGCCRAVPAPSGSSFEIRPRSYLLRVSQTRCPSPAVRGPLPRPGIPGALGAPNL